MSRIVVRLEVDRADVLLIGPLWFPVDGALVHAEIFASCGAHCVDVDHWHLLVQNL